MPNFFLNLYKPVGFSSFDCIRKLRHLLDIRKMGHMGTLDPFAEGVLVIGINKYTAFFDVFNMQRKTYRATAKLGTSTDTGDHTGNVREREKKINIPDDIEEFTRTLRTLIQKEYIGEVEQLPPMASAVRHKGRKLYEYHRLGLEIERKIRKCNVYSFDIVSHHLINDIHYFEFDICCSSGTYIRTLTEDLFKEFDIPSHLTKLIRTSVGQASLENTVKLSSISKQDIDRFCLYPEQVFRTGKFIVKKELYTKFRNGNAIDPWQDTEYCDQDFFLYGGYQHDGTHEGYYMLSENNMKVVVKL